jgi:hypothetical protein
MPHVVGLLARLRATYPKEYDVARARALAEIAARDPAYDETVRALARRGAQILPLLEELCGALRVTDLGALFTDAVSGASPEPGGNVAPEIDKDGHHLRGLICRFLAEGHAYRAEGQPDGEALATAERCYLAAESHSRAEENSWDSAWTHYRLGQIASQRGRSPAQWWDKATAEADGESDIELLANIERAQAEHLRSRRNLDDALPGYGRAVFYALALQVTAANFGVGADPYTQAFYRETRLSAVKVLAEPLLHDQGISPDDRLTEARRRLRLMLTPWGGSFEPDPARLDQALRAASRDAADITADTISEAAFPLGPDDDVLQIPDAWYYQNVRDLIVRTRDQPWVKGLPRLMALAGR